MVRVAAASPFIARRQLASGVTQPRSWRAPVAAVNLELVTLTEDPLSSAGTRVIRAPMTASAVCSRRPPMVWSNGGRTPIGSVGRWAVALSHLNRARQRPAHGSGPDPVSRTSWFGRFCVRVVLEFGFVFGEQAGDVAARVLTGPVGVEHRTRSGSTVLECHSEGVADQRRAHVIRHRPTDHASRRQVDRTRHVRDPHLRAPAQPKPHLRYRTRLEPR